MNKKSDWKEMLILFVFLSVPVISSVLSTFHIYDLVKLGNAPKMAMALAITYELGSLVSFITLFGNILPKAVDTSETSWLLYLSLVIFSVVEVRSGGSYTNLTSADLVMSISVDPNVMTFFSQETSNNTIEMETNASIVFIISRFYIYII